VASQATPGQFRCAGKEHQINRRIAACGGTQGTEEHQWTQGRLRREVMRRKASAEVMLLRRKPSQVHRKWFSVLRVDKSIIDTAFSGRHSEASLLTQASQRARIIAAIEGFAFASFAVRA